MSYPTLLSCNPADLKPNPWNTNTVSPDNLDKLENSIRRLEMFKPVIARELPDGTLQILGGQHRNDIAARIKKSSVPVYNLGPIDDKKAKEIGLIDNSRYGEDDTLKLAELLGELDNDLTSFAPMSEAEIASIFSASSIALDDLSLDDDDDAPAPAAAAAPQTHVIMRFKVPIEDSETVTAVIDAIMKAQKFTKDDSLSNAGNALVWLVGRGVGA